MTSRPPQKPKLYYFTFDGKGEIARLAFFLGGVEFEDIRIREEDWPEIKPTMPFELVPVLEIDGEQFGESVPIASYAAKVSGLHGRTNLEELKINQICRLHEDIWVPLEIAYHKKDPEVTAELNAIVKKETAPRYQRYLEELIAKYGKGYVLGDRLTLADIVIYDLYTGFLKAYIDDNLYKYPLSKRIVEKMADSEKIKEWIKKTQEFRKK